MNEPFDLPEMLDPTDVCSAMDDLAFMEYCYSHFDVNHDHKVGLHEARAVREIDLSDSKVVSLRGIEYFSNLERLILDRSTVRELHLLQNTKLKEISARGCVHLLHTELPNGLSAVPNNEIWYTSTNGKIVEPHNAAAFGANIVSNTYENSKGIISFDGEVTSIGYGAFEDCSSLTSILIPDSVTTIGKDAFYGCNSLTSITIPDSVTSIGNYAFYGCSSLSGITIPDSVVLIGEGAFYNCTGELIINSKIVETNYNDEKYPSDGWLWGAEFSKLTIGNSVTSIGEYAFYRCSSLTSITIPDSVTSIGTYVFYCCTSLTSITIPDSVTTIGYGAFENCSSLTSITIPDSVTEIGMYAFSGCTSLTSITIPDSVTSIGVRAFYYCTSLTSITIGNGVTSIECNVFHACSNLAEFRGKFASRDGKCLIVNGVLKKLTPKGISKYIIPEGVTSIGDLALCGCTDLKILTLPSSLKEIHDLYIGEIECADDQYYSSLEVVYCKALTPPKTREDLIGVYVDKSHCVFMVPPQSVDAYKASNWCIYNIKEYVDIEKINTTGVNRITIVSSDHGLQMCFLMDNGRSKCADLLEVSNLREGDIVAVDSAVLVKYSSNGTIRIRVDGKVDTRLTCTIQSHYLFLDTETSDLPFDYKAPASETYNWPRMVQLAWIVANKQGDILKKKSCIIRPEGYTISSSAAEVHGITTEKALCEGESLKKVLAEFGEDLAAAKVLVAHNMAFDKKIVHAEYIRLGCEDVWRNGPTERICTMMSSIDYCALPGFYDDYKWPKLQELHEKLFGYEFDDAHDALADVEATYRCYWQMRKLEIIR